MRGIIVGGMIIGLLLGCNNGGESAAEKGLSEIIASSKQLFLDVFVSFGDLLKDTFGITSTTTKKEVGEHLGKVGAEVKAIKDKLVGLKGNEQYNLIKDKADSTIAKAIETLGKIVEGTSKIKEATKNSSADKIANANGTDDAVQADKESVKSIVTGINLIYEAAKGVGTETKGNVNRVISNAQAVGKLFGTTGNVTDESGLKASNVAFNEANGADILAAIEASKSGIDTPPNAIASAKNAYDIAVATKGHGNLTTINTNASAIAAGLALKAMAQGGKLATHASVPAEGLNTVLIGVVDKTVNEIVSIIRRTVDKCLKNVSDCIKEDSSSSVAKSK